MLLIMYFLLQFFCYIQSNFEDSILSNDDELFLKVEQHDIVSKEAHYDFALVNSNCPRRFLTID